MRRASKSLFLVFIAALLLRLLLVFTAYHGDLNNNISWGTLAVERGLNGLYEGKDWPYSAPNQPPLTIMMFAGARVIWQTIESAAWWLNNNFRVFPSPFIWFWESKGMILLVKLPAILADLGIGWLIYKIIKKREKIARLAAIIWLFNPVIWYNSSVWGQTDSLVNFLGLIAVFSLLRKKLILFAVFMTLSLLFKGSLAIFVPVLLFVALRQKHKLDRWVQAVASSLGTIFIVSIWFHPKLDLLVWLVNLYKDRILPGEIGYLTANAFNFWWLVDPGRILDSTIFLGFPARFWGLMVALGGIGGIIYWLRKKLTDKRIFASLVLVSLITFLFMTRIHERYLYPFFPVATVLLGLVPGLWIPYVVLSATHLLNLYHLFWAPSFAPLEALYQSPWLAQSIAIINILTFFYLLRLFRAQKDSA